MRLIWTTSNLPLSRLIRWGLNEPVSHFAIVFDNKWVFHSSLYGVQIQWLASFKKHNDVIFEYSINLPYEEEEKIYTALITTFDETPYDYKALIYFMFAAVKKRILGIPFPAYNKWQHKDALLCTGVATLLSQYFPNLFRNHKDYEIISPYQIYIQIKDKENQP